MKFSQYMHQANTSTVCSLVLMVAWQDMNLRHIFHCIDFHFLLCSLQREIHCPHSVTCISAYDVHEGCIFISARGRWWPEPRKENEEVIICCLVIINSQIDSHQEGYNYRSCDVGYLTANDIQVLKSTSDLEWLLCPLKLFSTIRSTIHPIHSFQWYVVSLKVQASIPW